MPSSVIVPDGNTRVCYYFNGSDTTSTVDNQEGTSDYDLTETVHAGGSQISTGQDGYLASSSQAFKNAVTGTGNRTGMYTDNVNAYYQPMPFLIEAVAKPHAWVGFDNGGSGVNNIVSCYVGSNRRGFALAFANFRGNCILGQAGDPALDDVLQIEANGDDGFTDVLNKWYWIALTYDDDGGAYNQIQMWYGNLEDDVAATEANSDVAGQTPYYRSGGVDITFGANTTAGLELGLMAGANITDQPCANLTLDVVRINAESKIDDDAWFQARFLAVQAAAAGTLGPFTMHHINHNL